MHCERDNGPRAPGNIFTLIALIGAAVAAPGALAQPRVLDDFDKIDDWRLIASDGVRAELKQTVGQDGPALRLEFDFKSGAGFCVVRRELALELPENYRFSFQVRGEAPPNNLEFKLYDESGENVWWVNRRDLEFPKERLKLTQKKRHLQFAWGPSGGEPIHRISAIEFAVAASSGGSGYVEFDQLEFEQLPIPQPPAGPPLLAFSSAVSADKSEPVELDPSGRVDWRSRNDDADPSIIIDFGQAREFGGLMIDWEEADFGVNYDVRISTDRVEWENVATVKGGTGGRDYIPIPEAEATFVRVDVRKTSRDRGVGVRALGIMDVLSAETPNATFSHIARNSPRGWFPQYFLGELEPWTVVGAVGDDEEALIGANGAIELGKGAARLEPFLLIDGRLTTWADVTPRQSLAEGYLPIPSVAWETPNVLFDVAALAAGEAGRSELLARYRVQNRGADSLNVTLFVAVRPFQVLPPWQDLNITGGVANIENLAWHDGLVHVGGEKIVQPWRPPDGVGVAGFAQGDVVEYLNRGELPVTDLITDPAGLASGALRYDFELKPGETQTVVLSSPFHEGAPEPSRVFESSVEAEETYARALQRTSDEWKRELNHVSLKLPKVAQRIVDTFRTTQAYILINADGPAIQPGSRNYERSWIRDGALTSTALLYTGHADRVRGFIEWYAPCQFDGGKVPCVVDKRGPDPVPEHDSTGELIYLLLKYYRFTHDRGLLEENLPRVVAGVDYIESLRGRRMTDEYRDGPPEKRACYGLVPESISHEGYSAKPMHSYWDSFFVLRGIEDATTIANILDQPELEQRFAKLRDEYRTALYDSMRLAMLTKQIDFIPGCVELGDFDATSTAIGVFPCGQYGVIPEPALTNTFERYFQFFRERRDGALEWEAYTPYEIRLVGTFTRLGQPERAHELLDFFFGDQRPAGWRHWAEVVWRDPRTPRFIGDMPHTWVGSAYINAVRGMFVYENERDDSLVLAAGVKPEWLTAGGVAAENLPTEYGTISYSLKLERDALILTIAGDADAPLKPPPGGIVLKIPASLKIASVQADGGVTAKLTETGVRLDGVNTRVIVRIER